MGKQHQYGEVGKQQTFTIAIQREECKMRVGKPTAGVAAECDKKDESPSPFHTGLIKGHSKSKPSTLKVLCCYSKCKVKCLKMRPRDPADTAKR